MSTLLLFRRSPAHARHAMLHPSAPTQQQELGTAVHSAILEPDDFEARYCAAPVCDRRTKAGKLAFAKFTENNAEKIVLSASEYAKAIAMRDAVWASPDAIASKLLSGIGHNEISAVWEEPETGVLCKVRVDRLVGVGGWSFVVDIKTCKDASPDTFSRELARWGYHHRAAFYLDALKSLADLPRRFVLLCVESDPPHAVAAYELASDAIAEGRRGYRNWLRIYARCEERQLWPSYPTELQALDIPRWSYTTPPGESNA